MGVSNEKRCNILDIEFICMRIFRIENDDRVGFIWGKMKYHLPYELEYDYIRDDIKDKNGIMTERRYKYECSKYKRMYRYIFIPTHIQFIFVTIIFYNL